MRKTCLVILFVVILISSLSAEFNAYGSARVGFWYDMQNKELTGGESRMVFHHNFYKNSRFGVNWKSDNITAKAELGFADGGAVLRHLWAEYGLGNMKIMVGQNFTGLFDLGSQACSFIYGLDGLLFAYGAIYDIRHPMIKLTFHDMPYIMLMKPELIDPTGVGNNGIDAMIPKINFGLKKTMGNFYIHPSLAVNMSKYNKDVTGMDDSVLAYVFVLTGKFSAAKFTVKFQANYGQNIADYGVKTAVVGNAVWNIDKVENATTMGGYFQCSYQVCSENEITAGLGYTQGDIKGLDDPDNASTAFLQSKIKLHENFFIVPEVGLIDEMKDGMGNKEGTHTYFGFKMQSDIK